MDAWIAGLLGPVGLVCGMLIALGAFATERIVPGAALARERALNEALLRQNEALRRQNEALLRRMDRMLVVSKQVVDADDGK